MTYTEIRKSLTKCEVALRKLKKSSSENPAEMQKAQKKVEAIKESLEKRLKLLTEDQDQNTGTITTGDEYTAERLAKNGVNVNLKTEQEDEDEGPATTFDRENTNLIAQQTGKALGKSLRNNGDEVDRMVAKDIEPGSFSLAVNFKGGESKEYQFYVDDQNYLHIKDESGDKTLVDIGAKPSGEPIVQRDVLSGQFTKYFKTMNEEGQYEQGATDKDGNELSIGDVLEIKGHYFQVRFNSDSNKVCLRQSDELGENFGGKVVDAPSEAFTKIITNAKRVRSYADTSGGMESTEDWRDSAASKYDADKTERHTQNDDDLESGNVREEEEEEKKFTPKPEYPTIQKEYKDLVKVMKHLADRFKTAQGPEKQKILAKLKTLTAKKHALEAEMKNL